MTKEAMHLKETKEGTMEASVAEGSPCWSLAR